MRKKFMQHLLKKNFFILNNSFIIAFERDYQLRDNEIAEL